MTNHTEHAVSPVVAVILMVAVTVVLSASIGAFVFDLGQSTTDGQSQQNLGVSTSQSDGTYTVQVVTGTADKLHIMVDGTVEASLSNPNPGDEVSAVVGVSDKVTVVSVRDGEDKVIHTEDSTTSPTIPTDGLVSNWEFDEGSGTTAKDSVSSYDASLTNTTWVDGHVGSHALAFPESDSHGRVADTDGLEGAGGHTVTAWVKTSTVEYQDILSKWDQANSDRNWLLMLVTNNGELYVRGHVSNGSGGDSHIDSTASVATGEWEMVTQTWNGSTLTIYLNGKPVGNVSPSLSLSNTPTDVYIGDRESGTSARQRESLNGSLDGAYFYNRALSQTEVEKLYDATK